MNFVLRTPENIPTRR